MTTPSWIMSLPDSGIEADLLKYASTDVLTDSAATQILTDLANRGSISAAEFSSLQTIASNLNNGLSTSAEVVSLFTQLVDGSPANATWTGGATTSVALGNLQVGTTATQLNELIGQWFLGTNLPNPALPSGSTSVLTGYSNVVAPLYGSTGVAAVNDISQGAGGDCEFLSGLIDMVDNHPQLLNSMIINNGNGTYGVRFYLNGNEVWETVNDQFPTGPQGLDYAHNYNEQTTALWAAMIEKAYAQLSATGLTGNLAVNSYNNISADPPTNVLQELTDCTNVTYYFSSNANWYNEKSIFIAALASDDDVIVEVPSASSDTYDSSGKIELISDHAEAVIGYDSTTGNFIVRNPWGNSYSGQNWDAQFEVSLTTIASVNGDFVIDNSGNNASTIAITTASEQILQNGVVSIAGLFKVANSSGAPILEFTLQLVGPGSIQLNGATNLATTAQSAQGQIVVSASDLAKLSLTSTATSGAMTDLLVSAYDGASWSATADIQLTSSASGAALNPTLGLALAANATVPVSTLFHLSGSLAPGDAWYEFVLPTGGGSINLNGAQNVWANAPAGSYEIAASQLSLVTYTAPLTGGSVTLQADVYSGSSWTPWQNIQFAVGVSGVNAAIQANENGQLSAAANVSDAAINVFANLDALQNLFSAGILQTITLTDSTLQHETLSEAQYANDRGLLSILAGNYALTVTGATAAEAIALATAPNVSSVSVADSAADVVANLGALQTLVAAGELNSIVLTDGGTPTLTITATQMSSDAAVIADIAGTFRLDVTGTAATAASLAAQAHVSFVSVIDSATDVVANLAALQPLAVAGQLNSIVLTDGGTPTLTITAAQLSSDAVVIADISSNFHLDVTGTAAGTATSVAAQAHVVSVSVIDSAAHVVANLSALESLAAAGELTSIAMTDSGTPTLSLAATQLVQDAAAIHDISGSYLIISGNTDVGASTLHAGNLVTITLTTSGVETVTGAPSLQLNDNEVAGFTGGSGTNTLTFSYAVQPGDNVADLQVTGLNLPAGASIENQSGQTLASSVTSDLGSQVATTTVPATSAQQEILGLYCALYNRATDFNGLSYWANVVGQQPDGAGVTAANAASTAVTTNDATVLGQQFVNSQSTYFNSAYGSLTDNAFINALYVNIAGNAGDPNGVAYWANLLTQAEGSNPTAAQVQAARAGLAGQFVHDLIDYNLSTATGLTSAQLMAATQRQETIDNKIAVSEALSNASQQPGGGILVVHAINDAAFQAATTLIQGVTYDPATVTAAILGISNAIAHQNLSLI